ncbi:MAG: methionyl-tRNA formyltransferase [Gammaproteobacteria bacterium]|nr:methionyl-tRNA formyltransferase [Gammaproteobacteria bacterium]MDE2345269.1 methionyl-tRNA formyltransferase [Gammaproteobacteria bacterium]
MRIAFAGTPDFALPALQALRASGHEILGVWTQPDRPAGRGRNLRASPIKQYAQAHSLPIYQPATFRSGVAQNQLAALRPDVMVVAAYGLLLPEAVLAIPRYGCINIHASLLPRWRGAAPIQRAILAGDKETGITLMQMSKDLDCGDILLVRKTAIHADDTAQSLHDRLASLGAKAIVDLLAVIPEVHRTVQRDAAATYAAKLTRADARVDWTSSAVDIERAVRAFNPWPVAHTRWRGDWLKIWNAQVVSVAVSEAPGTVIAAGRDGIDVVTGKAVLRIKQLQAAGRRRVAATDFAHSHALVGERFS